MHTADREHDIDSATPRGSFLSLPVIFVIGWIIYEVTHEPAIAAMAMCLKFGWEDFRTALWLLRTDPRRGRGRSCCWLYIASGLWQVAAMGVAMVLLTVVLAGMLEGGPQAPAAANNLLKLLAGAAFTILFGFIFSTVATYVALLCARRYRVRPWLNRSVHFARRNREWPPLYGHKNRAWVPVISSIFMTCFILAPFCLFMAVEMLRGAGRGAALQTFAALGAVASIVVLLPVLLIAFYRMNRNGFFAEHPADCWGETPLPVKKSADGWADEGIESTYR